MEKRLKYLLGLFIVGFGLLINQSFGFGDSTIPVSDVYIEGVTLPLIDSNFQSSSNYRYKFHNFGWSYYSSKIGSMMYTILKDGSETWYPYSGGPSQHRHCSFDGSQYMSNNSAFGLDLYNGRFVDLFANGNCNGFFVNQSNGGYSPIKVSLGLGSDFGKSFVYTNSVLNDSGVVTPHYGLGNGFFTSNNFRTIYTQSNQSGNNFFRFFYNQNVNLTSPLDGFDLVTVSGVNLSDGYIAFENFTSQNTIYQTQYQPDSLSYLVDYGSQGLKGLHFGGYGVGYSYVVDFSQDNSTFYRGNRSFSSLGSRCGLSAMQLGFSSFNAYTSNNCLSLGLLVLKGDTYVSRQNNASVLILGKNPNNYKQILYEQFDCADDDILRIMDVGSGFCNSLSHGYITINGNGDVLPFSNPQDTYTLGSGNPFLDFLFKQGVYGYVSIDTNNNKYCLNSANSQLCFGLHATPNLRSLKEMYLSSSGDIAGFGGTVGGAGLNDIVINQPQSYYTYTGLVEYTMQGQYTVTEDSGYIDNYVDYVWVNGVPQLKDLKFGVCPFVTNSNFATLGFEDFSFDFLVPHKCILAGLQAGYTSVNMSGIINLNLTNKFFDSNLNNQNVEIIGHFVAILLILGISLLVFYFLKLFK